MSWNPSVDSYWNSLCDFLSAQAFIRILRCRWKRKPPGWQVYYNNRCQQGSLLNDSQQTLASVSPAPRRHLLGSGLQLPKWPAPPCSSQLNFLPGSADGCRPGQVSPPTGGGGRSPRRWRTGGVMTELVNARSGPHNNNLTQQSFITAHITMWVTSQTNWNEPTVDHCPKQTRVVFCGQNSGPDRDRVRVRSSRPIRSSHQSSTSWSKRTCC